MTQHLGYSKGIIGGRSSAVSVRANWADSALSKLNFGSADEVGVSDKRALAWENHATQDAYPTFLSSGITKGYDGHQIS
jgi:hypothetical protein